ncbi:MAG: sugar transferase [Raoultibacter sp.]|jgi:hypothetical protein
MQMEALKETELTPESPFDENPYYGVGRVGHSVSEEEFFRKASKRREGKLDAGRTVRSGYAYDFDSTDQVPFSDFERAAKVKAELGEGKVEGLGNRPVYRVVKRAFDIVFSGLVLVCFSWLYLLIALIVKIDDPKGPVFFRQTRVGMNGKEFQMLKFRSMCVYAEEKLASLQELNEKTGPVFKIADDPRIASRIIDTTARRSSFGPAVASVFPPKMPEISAAFSQVKMSISNLQNLLKNSFQNLLSHTSEFTNFFAECKTFQFMGGPLPCHSLVAGAVN